MISDENTDLIKQLRCEEKEERQIAKQFIGCSFYGEHPSDQHRRRANLLDLVATKLEIEELKRLRAKENG